MVEKTNPHARADDAGDKSPEFSDAAKMDKLMDMMSDACAKLDAASDRFDGFEERFKKADARMDAMEADKSKKDAEEEGEEDKPKEPAADKKKDASEEEEEKAKADAAKKDAEEAEEKAKADAAKKDADDKEKEEGAKADAAALRQDNAAIRAEIAAVAARLPKALTDDERAQFATIQAEADRAFQAFGDRAGAPLDGETPLFYKRRLVGLLQKHSPSWAKARITSIADMDALDTIATQVYADSVQAARRGVDLPAGSLRRIERSSGTGHTIYEYEGDSPASWMHQFAGPQLKTQGDFKRP